MIHATLAALLVAVLLPAAASRPPDGTDPVPTSSGTADPPAIAWMTVEIWPEYDDPRVLVIYRGALAPSAETPTDFSFVIPPGAQIHMAGGIAPDGGHMHGSYETEIREDGLVEVAYRLDVPDFYMEFYYDPFTDGEDRRFTYPVVSPYDVPSLAVSVQEPRRAEGFELSPITTEIVQDERGFDYRILRWSDVRAGTSAPVTVRYRKDDREPSVASPEVGRVSGTTGGAGFGLPGGLPAILAVVLATAGTYVLVLRWQRSRPIDAEVHRTAFRSEPLTPAGALPRFCSHCGKGITLRDRYCAWCGEPTRVADAAGGGTF